MRKKLLGKEHFAMIPIKRAICTALSLTLCMPYASFAQSEGARVFHRHKNNSNKIAITFDDGPHAKYTDEILEILSENNVHATFFVVGENAERYPDIIRRELAAGHEIGNHTYSHPLLHAGEAHDLLSELKNTEIALYNAAEYRPRLFRPPGGFTDTQVIDAATQLDYSVILWTVDTRDWTHPSVDNIVQCVRDNVCSGSIILFHDCIGKGTNTPQALRIIIPELLKAGYEPVTVSELLESL